MKKLIMIIMYLTFCVPIIWTQTHQIKDAIQIGSVKENNLDTSLVVNVTKEQVQDLVINSYLSKDEIDNKIMKTKIIWGITLRTLHIILGVLLIILCVVVGVLYYLYSRLSIRNREYENEAYVMKRCVKRLEQNVQDCSSRVDYMHRRVKESIGSEIDSTISDVKDEKTKENLKSENVTSSPLIILTISAYTGVRKELTPGLVIAYAHMKAVIQSKKRQKAFSSISSFSSRWYIKYTEVIYVHIPLGA